MMTTRIAVLAVLFTVISSQDTPDIRRIGNQLRASASGVDIPGAIFLVNDLALDEGIVFAFSAFFRYDTKVRLQIWRPVEEMSVGDNNETTGGQMHMLVGELEVIPSVVESREDIYIESRITEPCIRVKKEDRLGVYFEEAPGAVSYAFDKDTPTALGTRVDEAVEIGNGTVFNQLVFPYDFSVAAYFHADIESYNLTDDTQFVECPKGMLIPEYDPISLSTTTSDPITGRPGDTGATGPNGDTGSTGPMGEMGATGFGATGATGEMGPEGQMGATGMIGATGAQGTMGAEGAIGATGPQGEKGDRGERGPAGDFATVQPLIQEAENETDTISWILLVWLIIVTIILFIILIGLCFMYRRYRRDQDAEKQYTHAHTEAGYGNGAYDSGIKRSGGGGSGGKSADNGVKYSDRIPSYLEGDVQPSWTNTMKSIAESTYSIDTIGNDSTKNSNANSPKGGEKFAHDKTPLEASVSDSNSNTGLVGNQNDVVIEPSSPTSIDSKYAI